MAKPVKHEVHQHKHNPEEKVKTETKPHRQPTADDIGAAGDTDTANKLADSEKVNKDADAADAFDSYDKDNKPVVEIKKPAQKKELPPPKGDVAKKEVKAEKHELTPEVKKAPLPSKLDEAKQEVETQSKAQRYQDNEEP